jgi:hypothetical protein
MKRRWFSTIVLGSMLLLGASVWAQGKDAKKPTARPAAAADSGQTATPRVKNFDFDADVIDGELVKPEGEFLNARKFAEHGSLIKVRADFIREIVKSAEDL